VAGGGGAGRCDSNTHRERAAAATPEKLWMSIPTSWRSWVGAGRCDSDAYRERAAVVTPEKLVSIIAL